MLYVEAQDWEPSNRHKVTIFRQPKVVVTETIT